MPYGKKSPAKMGHKDSAMKMGHKDSAMKMESAKQEKYNLLHDNPVAKHASWMSKHSKSAFHYRIDRQIKAYIFLASCRENTKKVDLVLVAKGSYVRNTTHSTRKTERREKSRRDNKRPFGLLVS